MARQNALVKGEIAAKSVHFAAHQQAGSVNNQERQLASVCLRLIFGIMTTEYACVCAHANAACRRVGVLPEWHDQ